MITQDELSHLAKLAKLKLSDAELKKLTSQLDDILIFVSQLDEIEANDVEVTNQTTALKNIYRDDIIVPCDVEQELLECSPHEIKNNSIVVPRIL